LRQAYDYWQDQPGSYPRGHTNGAQAVCSDSARSARPPQAEVPPSTRRKGTRGKEGRDDYEQRHDDTHMPNGRAPATHSQRAGAHATKRPTKRPPRGGRRRTEAPRAADARQNGTMQDTARKHDVVSPPLTIETKRVRWVGAWGRLLPVMISMIPSGRRGTEYHGASNTVYIVLHGTFRDRAGVRHGQPTTRLRRLAHRENGPIEVPGRPAGRSSRRVNRPPLLI